MWFIYTWRSKTLFQFSEFISASKYLCLFDSQITFKNSFSNAGYVASNDSEKVAMNHEHVTIFKGSVVGCWEITTLSTLVWEGTTIMKYLTSNSWLDNGDTTRHLPKTSVKCSHHTHPFRELFSQVANFNKFTSLCDIHRIGCTGDLLMVRVGIHSNGRSVYVDKNRRHWIRLNSSLWHCQLFDVYPILTTFLELELCRSSLMT